MSYCIVAAAAGFFTFFLVFLQFFISPCFIRIYVNKRVLSICIMLFELFFKVLWCLKFFFSYFWRIFLALGFSPQFYVYSFGSRCCTRERICESLPTFFINVGDDDDDGFSACLRLLKYSYGYLFSYIFFSSVPSQKWATTRVNDWSKRKNKENRVKNPYTIRVKLDCLNYTWRMHEREWRFFISLSLSFTFCINLPLRFRIVLGYSVVYGKIWQQHANFIPWISRG